VPPKKNKGLAIQVIPKLVEGYSAKYITGSGQTHATADRVHIYEIEGCVRPFLRGKGGRKNKSNPASSYRNTSSSVSENPDVKFNKQVRKKKRGIVESSSVHGGGIAPSAQVQYTNAVVPAATDRFTVTSSPPHITNADLTDGTDDTISLPEDSHFEWSPYESSYGTHLYSESVWKKHQKVDIYGHDDFRSASDWNNISCVPEVSSPTSSLEGADIEMDMQDEDEDYALPNLCVLLQRQPTDRPELVSLLEEIGGPSNPASIDGHIDPSVFSIDSSDLEVGEGVGVGADPQRPQGRLRSVTPVSRPPLPPLAREVSWGRDPLHRPGHPLLCPGFPAQHNSYHMAADALLPQDLRSVEAYGDSELEL